MFLRIRNQTAALAQKGVKRPLKPEKKKSGLNGIRTHIGYRRVITEVMSWLDSSIGLALCSGIAEVMGLNPVQAWIIFQASISQLLKVPITPEFFFG